MFLWMPTTINSDINYERGSIVSMDTQKNHVIASKKNAVEEN